MSTQTNDPIAAWFFSLQELGEFIGIRFGRVAPGASEPEWLFLPHTEVDGIGGLGELLRQRGAVLERLPQIKHPLSPSLGAVLRALPQYLKPRHPVKWRPLDQGPTTPCSQPAPAVAWHLFNENETTQIRRVCRKAGYTVNSFLLKHLTKAIRPSLHDESSPVPWMVPVNIRGKIDRGRDTNVHTSYVGVKVRTYETVKDIHRNIYAALGKGEHWANWRMYLLGRFTNGSFRRFLLARGLGMSQWYLGAFSNLGDWDPEKKLVHPACAGGWLFAPPVLRCQLVGAGCVTFQNQLSLTIQAHAELTTSPAVARSWIQNWVKEIELDVASVLEPGTGRRTSGLHVFGGDAPAEGSDLDFARGERDILPYRERL